MCTSVCGCVCPRGCARLLPPVTAGLLRPQRCKYDACNCQNSEGCLCAALSSYARACAAKGVLLWGWREQVCSECRPWEAPGRLGREGSARCSLREGLPGGGVGTSGDPRGPLGWTGLCLSLTEVGCSGVAGGEGSCGRPSAPHAAPPVSADEDVGSCPSSQVFLYNLTTCQPTCRSLSEADAHCPQGFAPVDGCGCPDDTFLDEKGRCVPLAKCSCYHHGLYLEAGEVVLRQEERW